MAATDARREREQRWWRSAVYVGSAVSARVPAHIFTFGVHTLQISVVLFAYSFYQYLHMDVADTTDSNVFVTTDP
jgi:hypothetical protein